MAKNVRGARWGERQRQKAVEAELSERRLLALIAKADAAGLHRRSMMRLSEMPCIILNGDRAVYLDAGEVKDYDTGDNITLAVAERLLGLEG